jgi:glycosyltransferase involved in cell wall biosynthesis
MVSVPLRILQTCFSHSWGGLEIHTLRAVSRLHQRGHEVWLACLPDSRLTHEAEYLGFNTLTLNVKGYVHPRLIMRMSKFLNDRKISVIHSQLSRDIATVVPAMLLSGKKAPVILSKRMGSYISKRDLFHRFTYKHVSCVLAISEVIRKNVIETTPMKPENVITLHEPVDTQRFDPACSDRLRTRSGCDFTDDDFVIGFVGRFSPGKGHEDFLIALKLLKEKYRAIKAWIVGEASHGEEEYERKIHNLAQSAGLGDILRFSGFRKDIADVMYAFDLFAFPSHAEAFGAALVEAMAMERPVVSTNCDGVVDIIINGVTGLYVNPHSPQELADAIGRLIENPALRRQMGIAGRKRVLTHFDERIHIERIETLYYSLLKNFDQHPSK